MPKSSQAKIFIDSILSVPGSIKTRHLDEFEPLYKSTKGNYFNNCLQVLFDLEKMHHSPIQKLILAIPLEDTKEIRELKNFDVSSIAPVIEPPSIYITEISNLVLFQTEEVMFFSKNIINSHCLLLKSWRDEVGHNNNWEYNNCCFVWKE